MNSAQSHSFLRIASTIIQIEKTPKTQVIGDLNQYRNCSPNASSIGPDFIQLCSAINRYHNHSNHHLRGRSYPAHCPLPARVRDPSSHVCHSTTSRLFLKLRCCNDSARSLSPCCGNYCPSFRATNGKANHLCPHRRCPVRGSCHCCRFPQHDRRD